MGRKKNCETVELAAEDIPDLIKAVETNSLSDKHKEIVLTLIRQVVSIHQTAKDRAAALKRIKRMLENSTEKMKKPEDQEKGTKPATPKKNHGRNGVDDYQFAHVIHYPHQQKCGDNCPDCNHGTLQQLEPGKVIRLTGQPAIIAELHRPEKLRCSGCGQTFTAQLPEEIGDEKATASANAMVAVFRYGMGIPHYRLATIQMALGVPLPPSTQYEMVEMLWTHVVPVFKELLQQAAGWPLLFVDDTRAKVLSLMKENEQRKEDDERTGMFTTAMVARQEEKKIHLFFTGRKHAGENLAELLTKRCENLPPPIQVSDALSRNVPKEHLTLLVLCLIHARRNFIDSHEAFPDETIYVIERIGKVYKNEGFTKHEAMNPQRRMEYHQQNSASIMEEIKTYAQAKLEKKEVEANSVLGGAFKYLLKFWIGLTQFLRIPGAPLDTNEVERLVKKSILHLKNSLFYKTENGAMVGDVLMSLIQTAIAAGVNPFDYLTVLQKHSRHVAKNPALWLPWNYTNILKSVQPPKPG